MNYQEFHRRRQRFIRALGPDSIALIATNPIQYRNRDVEYPFRPESDFYYLSGFPEPRALLVIIPQRPAGTVLLFCQERNFERELWNGPQIGVTDAKPIYLVDEAYPITQLDDLMPVLLENRDQIYYSWGMNPDFDRQVMNWVNQVRRKIRTGVHAPSRIVDIQQVLHEQRLIKTPAELRRIRKATRISANAHRRAMQICRPGIYEYQLEALLLREFTRFGARAQAYTSIVAAGDNSCILHYTKNNSLINDGDLVLIDAGCEFEYYAADITRTFPANGHFTPAQRTIYSLVLKAQLAALDAVRPGNNWNQPHAAAVKTITEGLVELNLLAGDVAELIAAEKYKCFYPHRTGHWLGLDVHDVGSYKVNNEWRALKPGMVLTVEPGIYLPRNATDIPEEYRGIGIRIEDTCVVTKNGLEILTTAVPKDPDEIEQLMNQK